MSSRCARAMAEVARQLVRQHRRPEGQPRAACYPRDERRRRTAVVTPAPLPPLAAELRPPRAQRSVGPPQGPARDDAVRPELPLPRFESQRPPVVLVGVCLPSLLEGGREASNQADAE